MPNERTIPSDEPKSVVTYTILSAGNEISDAWQLLSLTVHNELNRISSATIIILDGAPSAESFDISNQPEFEPGKEIEIKCGYRNDEESIFKGIVIKHGIKVRKQNSVIMVECRDKAVNMTNVCKSKYFKEVNDSDIIEELIDSYGIEKDVEATTVEHKQVVQYNSTDWDFMLCRTEANGMFVTSEDGKLIVGKPDFSAAPVLTVQYGATIQDLDAEIDSRLQYKSVKGSSWDYSGQELLENIEAEEPALPEAGNLDPASLAEVSGEEQFNLIHSGKIEEPELLAWVNAKMLRHRLARIRGKVSIDGTAVVKPGTIIELNGVGERFEGKLFVSGVRHFIEKGNWTTSIQFGINPEWFAETYKVEQPLAGALLPAIQGLQIGIVTKLEADPDGEDRIMVRLPVIHKDDEGIWSRVCTLDAGDKRGTFFRPEIGDEVIVGFINNDPRHAVVLGMCNSSSKPAPVTAADVNHEKGYVSRSEMKLMFNDEKKIITIESPAGNKVIISEEDKAIKFEDQNGNKITMNEDGIKIESIKDIIMKAPQGDMKGEAINVELKASAQAKVQGSAGAKLESSGSTTVKGSIVQIN